MKLFPRTEHPTMQEPDVAAASEPAPETGATLRQRALLLFACLALGLGVGLVGQHFTSSTAWFLAIPICLAVGWFFVADPTACIPHRASRGHDKGAAPG